jgi:hypothetical protein
MPEAFVNDCKQSIVLRTTTTSLKKARFKNKVEVTKALAALRPLYGHDNIEVVTQAGERVRGVVRSMKTTQALTTPSVKIERADGEIIKIPFSVIIEIIDHNHNSEQKAAGSEQ